VNKKVSLTIWPFLKKETALLLFEEGGSRLFSLLESHPGKRKKERKLLTLFFPARAWGRGGKGRFRPPSLGRKKPVPTPDERHSLYWSKEGACDAFPYPER